MPRTRISKPVARRHPSRRAVRCRRSPTVTAPAAKILSVAEEFPRPKIRRHPKVLSEHAFDKLRLLDCTFAEVDAAIEHAEIIEEHVTDDNLLKEVVLVVDWIRPLHVIVVVDDRHEEERIVTVYEPDPDLWSPDYRRRR
jgi:hypothetical protein